MMRSNQLSMAATLAHACTPLAIVFYTRPYGRSLCRPTTPSCHQADRGAVFVGGCEADGGSAQGDNMLSAAAVTYLWSPGQCSGCVHGVSILLSYASTSITVCSPCRVGIYSNSSASAPVREPAKRNGPATSRDDQPDVNGEGPARNKARGTRRTPVDRKRPDTT